jgi:hypothetical protein
MKFSLEILMDNAAFSGAEGPPGTEVADILDKVATLVDGSYFSEEDGQGLHDCNGNPVGSWRVTS